MDVIGSYLKELRDVFSSLLNSRGAGLFTHYSVAPWIIAVFVVATSLDYTVVSTGIAVSVVLLVAGYCRGVEELSILKPLFTVLLIALVSSSPILMGVVSGDTGMAKLFILRTVSSTLLFIAGVRTIGWYNIVRGLAFIGVPRSILDCLLKTVLFIPLFIDDTLRMLVARNARVLGRHVGLRRTWSILAGVVADIIVKSYRRALMLSLAYTSRRLGQYYPVAEGRWSTCCGKPSIHDLLLTACSITVLFLEVLSRL